jgi:Alpha-tubulin suppressor and related RCC1 domain-containing proteins
VPPEGQLCSNGFNCSGDACKTFCSVAADCQDTYACVGGSCHVKALSVAVGGESACAVFVDGKVRCWGGDSIGELGDGQTRPYGQSISVPAPVIGISNAKAIAGGYQHYCALLGDGTVRCWGANNAGQMGNGGYDTASTPTAVAGLAGVTVTAIAGGAMHTCVLLSDSTIRCWGYNGSGQLGVLGGNPTTPQAPNLTGIKAVSAGGYHTCVIVSGGQVRCWGLNNNGQLGVTTVSFSTIDPQTVAGLSGAATAISAGDSHTCALLTDGTVWCWGGGNDGQLGTGDTNSSATPLSIYVAPATAISATSLSTCALLATKTVSCWGKVMNPNEYENDAGGVCLSPGLVTGASSAVAISANDHSCAVIQDGSILCWGWDYNASPSTFTTTATPVPAW